MKGVAHLDDLLEVCLSSPVSHEFVARAIFHAMDQNLHAINVHIFKTLAWDIHKNLNLFWGFAESSNVEVLALQ